ncbi:NRAMP family divalent metal transporter [Fodinicola acaciae]|uniref:NRAMP family divalent metal transporter n=1 Tax=Fodinicola acaciae TaxID=2681555 RepID=UPI0013D34364|nr:NRAMP family divalent metal transporter [Fodinicola acaciae]
MTTRPDLTTSPSSAVTDSAHVGDIVGALGTIGQYDRGSRRSWRQRVRTLLVIMGPGLIVMVGDNDAGGVSTYAQAGQNYHMGLLWTLALLVPVLYVNQEMVVRLGAVAGVGHARLIFARFGRFWGSFSVADLFMVNALTIVTEFIGVSQALGYFGLPTYVSVPLAAVLLFAAVTGGSFRRWERVLFCLIAVNVLIVPMALLVHPTASSTVAGLVPGFPGGLNSTLLLVIVAIVGTTVAPWQLFFQQSNVVDKRITPGWIRYERADLWIGIAVVMAGAIALMAVTAYGLAGTRLVGQFTDAAAVAEGLRQHAGPVVGALFAIILLDASLVGANAVGLATAYTLGDIMKKRHSLHWKISQAPLFYVAYGALIGVSAAVVLIPGVPLGLITQGVQALAGVLLPSATVFLILLCNDRAVLGPWVNSVRQNVVSGAIVWTLVLLSLSLTAATLFPGLSTNTLEIGFAVGAGVGVLGGAALLLSNRQAPVTRGVRDKMSWRTPALDTLPRPVFSPLRRAGMLTLRIYLALAIVLVILRIVQLAGYLSW